MGDSGKEGRGVSGMHFWPTTAYMFDIGHLYHGQLTAVKTRSPLTSIYIEGSGVGLIEITCVFEVLH